MGNKEHFAIFMQGPEVWNKWREMEDSRLEESGEFLFPDLSGANLIRDELADYHLSEYNFTEANLSKTYFWRADLSQTRFWGANLSGANLGEAKLREAHLTGANLTGTILNRSDLSEAKLIEANLSGAELRRTEALGTNFERAILTGACIEDWNINKTTQLDGVICDYVYLREYQQERRPHSGNFALGEFTKLFQKALETVDLIFLNGIEWEAFFASFQKLQIEAGSAELSIQAIEKKPDGAFVIRVNVPLDAKKAEIEKYLKREYKLKLKAIDEKYRYKLKAKDEEVAIYRQKSADFMEIVKLLASRPIDVKAIAISESESMSEASKYNMSSSNIANITDSYVNRGTQNISQNNYEVQKQNLAEAAAEIQQLLKQLEQSYPTNTSVEKATVAEEAIKQIENNPTFKQRILAAVKTFGIEAVKEAVNNPVFNVLVPTIQSLLTGS